MIIWRGRGAARRAAVRAASVAAACALVPLAAWVVVSDVVLNRHASSTGGVTSGSLEAVATVSGQLSYLWQAFLPKLPFMGDFFPYYLPSRIYFRGFVGRFGWAEYEFGQVWYQVALGVFVLLAVLAGRELWLRRAALRARWPELLTYAAMVCGLLLLVEIAAYRFLLGYNQHFEQTRYLFPLLALYGAVVAIAARGAGRRFGPALGAFLIVLAMGHLLFSQLLTIARFYS
jgi:hypothetical protein